LRVITGPAVRNAAVTSAMSTTPDGRGHSVECLTAREFCAGDPHDPAVCNCGQTLRALRPFLIESVVELTARQ